MDPRDIAIQATTPAVMVPKYSEFEPLAHNGHRFLNASNGLWIEARRPWFHLTMPLAIQDMVPMPFGQLKEELELHYGKIPKILIEQFIDYAITRSPHECAAWIILNLANDTYHLKIHGEVMATGSRVIYHRPLLSETESAVCDLHSHGEHAAGFSKQDDKDNRGDFNISITVGHCHKEEVMIAYRLCANGLYIPLCGEDIVE